MKKCKSCHAEIPDKATKCSKCGSDQRNWFRRHPIWTGILVLFILGMFGTAINGGSKSASTTSGGTSTATETKATEVSYKVGDVIKTDKFEIIVNSVEERSVVGSQYFQEKPSQGGTLIAVQYQVKNVSDKPVGSFSIPNIKLVDKNGTEYSADAGKSGSYATEIHPDSKFLSDLNPGITTQDGKVFEVSKEQYATPGWSLVVKADEDYKVLVK